MRFHAAGAAVAFAFALLACAATSAPLPIAYSITSNPSQQFTSNVGGVNVGHAFDAASMMFMKRLGVNGARMFGGNGGVTPTQNAPAGQPGAKWGADHSGSLVTNAMTYTSAQQTLRSSAGHDAAKASTFSNPPAYAAYDVGLSSADPSKPSGQSIATQVATLQGLGIEPLIVDWNTCGSFSLQSFFPSQPGYWQERWELYKHQYILASWAWKRGVRKLEFWNEPDLNAPCINFNATQWADYVVIQTSAINHAFADLNADVASGYMPCPQTFLSCPLTPIVHASAFALSTFSGDASPPAGAVYLGGPAVANEHTVFPGFTQSAAVQNMHKYSMHTYGKTGQQYQSSLSGLDTSIAAAHTDTTGLFPTLPVVVTEHAAHTSGSWGQTIPSTADDSFEAARLASQIARSLANGYESYIFKFSTTPSSNGGIAKTGIHWGDVTAFPYAVGDSTLSAEAARLVLKATVGGKSVDVTTVTSASTSSLPVPPAAFRVAYSTSDSARRYFLFVNDCAASSGVAADCAPGPSGTPNAADVNLTLTLTAWGVTPGTVLPVSLAAAGSFGEVSQLAVVSPQGTVNVFVPSGGVALVTGAVAGQQVVANLPSTDDATINPSSPVSTGASTQLTVSTSTTADHSKTNVMLVRFAVPATAKPGALTAAILELALAAAPATTMLMSIFGAACGTSWSENTVTWANAGTFAVNSSIAMNAPITTLAQNFMYVDSTTTAVGHITVPAGSAVGTVFRVDVTEYVAGCAGQGATFTIARRLRYPGYTGNLVGSIAADTLSGGAAVKFFSRESATGAPNLRLITHTAVATGVMSINAKPGAAGRRALLQAAADPIAINAALSKVTGAPTTATVTGMAVYCDLTIAGVAYGDFVRVSAAGSLLKVILEGIAEVLSEPTPGNILLQQAQQTPAGMGTVVGFIADGYNDPPDMGATTSGIDLVRIQANPTTLFSNLIAGIASAMNVPPSTISVTADPTTATTYAIYQVQIVTSADAVFAMETNFNSAVQAGVMQNAVAASFPGAGALTVISADPVQSQRYAVATALASAAPNWAGACQATVGAQDCPAPFKKWFGLGIAFIIVAGVALLALMGLIMFRIGVQYALRTIKPDPTSSSQVGVVVVGGNKS